MIVESLNGSSLVQEELYSSLIDGEEVGRIAVTKLDAAARLDSASMDARIAGISSSMAGFRPEEIDRRLTSLLEPIERLRKRQDAIFSRISEEFESYCTTMVEEYLVSKGLQVQCLPERWSVQSSPLIPRNSLK